MKVLVLMARTVAFIWPGRRTGPFSTTPDGYHQTKVGPETVRFNVSGSGAEPETKGIPDKASGCLFSVYTEWGWPPENTTPITKQSIRDLEAQAIARADHVTGKLR